MALWSNDFHQQMNQDAYQFNQSIHIDARLLKADLKASAAHAKMLGEQKIIHPEESKKLSQELEKMQKEYEQGRLAVDYQAEDVHSFIEDVLTERLGDVGKKIHTGRSRNDQVAVALKIYTADELDQLIDLTKKASLAFAKKAKAHLQTLMPSYTHLQRAQPISYGHYLMAYAEMLNRDLSRLKDSKARILNTMPLGAGALATTSFPLDREYTKELLGFNRIAPNSLDAVSDRDYTIEVLADLNILAMHLSRYAEETIIWTSQEFQFLTLNDTFSTGSSIMPQKKNADIHELMRGKTGRMMGNLISVLTVMKGLPLAYNKDMQEEKENLFDGLDTMKELIALLPAMLEETTANKDKMYQACGEGFINATDCADYLAAKGVSFRDAYQITGNILQYCMDHQQTLETLTIEEYQNFHSAFEEDIFQSIDLKNCMTRRAVDGGPAPEKVQKHIKQLEQELK